MRSSGRGAAGGHRMRVAMAGALATALGTVALAASAVLAQSPSPAGSAEPPGWSPSWSPAPPDAARQIVRDAFDPPGPWWTGSDETGTSSIAGGRMRWTIVEDRRSIWDAPELPAPEGEVRVEATVLVEEGLGAGGPLCAGSETGERAIWAGVNGGGEWIVGRIVDSRVQVIERGERPRVRRHDVPVGAPYPLLVTLECTVDPEGADHYTVWIEGVQVADVVDEPIGPFLRAGLMATADEAGFEVLFDDFAVFAGPELLPSPGPTSGA
jgi:hypothetical protein